MNFTCRVCGGDVCLSHYDVYYCVSCSVMFTSIDTFNLPPVKFKKLHEDACEPIKAKEGDIGFDVTSIEDIVIDVGDTVMVQTGISVELPDNTEIQVRPRSGMAKKHGIMVTNSPGTIDTGYRGPCNVLLTNNGKDQYSITKGDRIAQFVITSKMPYQFVEVDNLSDSDRGKSGFGDSGK